MTGGCMAVAWQALHQQPSPAKMVKVFFSSNLFQQQQSVNALKKPKTFSF